jgi:hypothetical protein
MSCHAAILPFCHAHLRMQVSCIHATRDIVSRIVATQMPAQARWRNLTNILALLDQRQSLYLEVFTYSDYERRIMTMSRRRPGAGRVPPTYGGRHACILLLLLLFLGHWPHLPFLLFVNLVLVVGLLVFLTSCIIHFYLFATLLLYLIIIVANHL